tara:strand:+ start:1994 stop:2110 length:117 start_codon:yes stop_codon:yes gene_type:complete
MNNLPKEIMLMLEKLSKKNKKDKRQFLADLIYREYLKL